VYCSCVYLLYIHITGHIDFPLQSVKLETNCTRNLRIKIPLISSPMDTVTVSKRFCNIELLHVIQLILKVYSADANCTVCWFWNLQESTMAIHMALHGGLGVIHYNMPIEDQAFHVKQVKRYKNGFIMDPICLSPDHTVADVMVSFTSLALHSYHSNKLHV
jgi:IMP dehydrogenase